MAGYVHAILSLSLVVAGTGMYI